MTVYYKDNGKWYCHFYLSNGKEIHRLCRGATTEKQAKKLENEIKYDFEMQVHGHKPMEQKNVYIKHLVELYTIHAKNNHKKFKNQIYYLNVLEKYFSNNKPVNDIKPNDIEKFKTYLKDIKNLKNSSINRYLEILSKMFNLAIANKELTENPVSKTEKLKEDNIAIRYLTAEEELRLFKSVDSFAPYLKPIIIMALQTGMRRGEILNLKWSNIKDNYIELLETKSGKKRNIPISEKLKTVLESIPNDNEYIFYNPKTNEPYTDIKKSWHKVIDEAKIKNFRFHDLRHTVATRMVEKGIDLLVVMDILGHTKIETTMRYAHPVTERKQAAINILNSYI